MSTDPNESANDPSAAGDEAFDQAAMDDLVSGASDGNAEPSAPDPANAPVEDTAAVSAEEPVKAVSQEDIDVLLQAAEAGGGEGAGPAVESPPPSEPDARVDTLGRPFDESAAATQPAVEEEKAAAAPSPTARPTAPPSTQPFGLTDLEIPEGVDVDPKRVSMLNDVNLRVRIELGRTRMLIEDVLKLDEGSVVELDKLAGDPVDVFVNDRLIGRGEVLVLNDNFCVRINEVLAHDPHRVSA